MENLGERISKQLSDLSDIEEKKIKIEFGIFNNKLNESYKQKIKAIENNFTSQADFYGKKEDEYNKEKNNILRKYTAEFQKIYDIRKEQFFNIINEIIEMQANQKIVFANINKVIEERDKYKEVNESDDLYYKKLEALTQKFDNYQAVINECEVKLLECTNCALEDFKGIVKYRNESIAIVKKTNFIFNLINKLMNIFTGKVKFQKEVVLKMNNELVNIEKNDNKLVNIISEQTLTLVAKIEEVRAEINNSFEAAIG